MVSSLEKQSEEFYRVFSALARVYQLHDRDETCRNGISVSQCYALDYVDKSEMATMGELAKALRLDLSSVTRAVDQLVQRRLVKREEDPTDRRVCRIRCTAKGSKLIEAKRKEMIAHYESILGQLSHEERRGAIEAISLVLAAYEVAETEPAVVE